MLTVARNGFISFFCPVFNSEQLYSLRKHFCDAKKRNGIEIEIKFIVTQAKFKN